MSPPLVWRSRSRMLVHFQVTTLPPLSICSQACQLLRLGRSRHRPICSQAFQLLRLACSTHRPMCSQACQLLRLGCSRHDPIWSSSMFCL
eukprot:666694-Amphidinium_carterae.2